MQPMSLVLIARRLGHCRHRPAGDEEHRGERSRWSHVRLLVASAERTVRRRTTCTGPAWTDEPARSSQSVSERSPRNDEGRLHAEPPKETPWTRRPPLDSSSSTTIPRSRAFTIGSASWHGWAVEMLNPISRPMTTRCVGCTSWRTTHIGSGGAPPSSRALPALVERLGRRRRVCPRCPSRTHATVEGRPAGTPGRRRRDRRSGHLTGGGRGPALSRWRRGQRGREVALGKNADEARAVHDRQAPDLAFGHHPRRVGQRCVGRRGGHVGRHHFFHDDGA